MTQRSIEICSKNINGKSNQKHPEPNAVVIYKRAHKFKVQFFFISQTAFMSTTMGWLLSSFYGMLRATSQLGEPSSDSSSSSNYSKSPLTFLFSSIKYITLRAFCVSCNSNSGGSGGRQHCWIAIHTLLSRVHSARPFLFTVSMLMCKYCRSKQKIIIIQCTAQCKSTKTR